MARLLAAAAVLLRDGHNPDLSPLYGRPPATLHRIPPYVFDTSSRFWFDGGVATTPRAARPTVTEPVAAAAHSRTPVPGTSEGTVLALIAEAGGYSPDQVARASRLSDDLGYDSLLQLRLFEQLRAVYPQLQSIPIVDVLPKIHTVGDIVDFVVERLGTAAEVR